MSDIRSFFGKKPDSAKTSNSTTSLPNKKKRLVISDSDDDDILEIPVNNTKKRKTESPQTVNKNNIRAPIKKQVTAPTDFFGCSKVKSVKKEEKPVVKKPKKPILKDESDAIEDFSDDEIFSDASFMETLDGLGKDDAKKKKLKENVTPPSPGGLSEKLSLKKKGVGWKDKVGISSKEGNSSLPQKKRPRDTEDEVLLSPASSSNIPKLSTPGRASISETPEASGVTPTRKGNTGYWAYKNREGPKNLGSKEIPTGAPNCLEGLTFVISGVLDSIDRDEATSLIQRYGGRVTSAVSKKTSYLVKGEGCGASKLEKADKLNIKQVDEEALLELIRTKPGKKSAYDIKVEQNHKKEKAAMIKKVAEPKPTIKPEPAVKKRETTPEPAKKMSTPFSKVSVEHNPDSGKRPIIKKSEAVSVVNNSGQPWTEKYRPTKIKDIIGQQGDKSNVKKLLHWLKMWERWHAPGSKPPFSKEEGSHLKAALLSGPPGVGKTTSATVCCREQGFTYIEMNASDARSKKSMQMYVADLLNNHTINGLITKGASADKHVLIMDEVDGMAGNEDRGGMGELIQLIKSSRIPILCICNDRNAQKIRSLSNHCFDLRFCKPRLEQVKAAMMSIAFKEGLRVPPPAMQKIVEGANNDIRQVLNNLRMWTVGSSKIDYDQALEDSKKAKKDTKMGIFDIPRMFFTASEETRKYTYMNYAELFFQDYSMTPFFMFENYPRSRPMRAQNNSLKTLKCMSNAADSICFGDTISAAIRMENWALLPTQAHFSAIMPGFYMRGGLQSMVVFPSVLGQISKSNRCDGQLKDLLSHMILNVNTDKRQLGMEYMPLLKHKLVTPLIKEDAAGVPAVIQMMHEYDLQRDDWDNIMELSTFSPSPNPATKVSTKAKSAFTRQFNKLSHNTPYALESAAVKKRKTKAAAGGEEEGSGDDADDGEDGNDDLDAMIKPKAQLKRKPPAPKSLAKPKSGEPSKKRATKSKKT